MNPLRITRSANLKLKRRPKSRQKPKHHEFTPMTMKRSGSSWMPAPDYGKSLAKFSVNLLVRDVQVSLPFYRDVLGATVRYADADFAALNLASAEFMLHADPAQPEACEAAERSYA